MNKRIRKKKGLAKITIEECWSLDETLAKLILPRLQKYIQINEHGYPHTLNNHEEWHEIIQKMIFAFDIIANRKYPSIKNKNWLELEVEQTEKIQEGLDLFAKYFRNLWD